MAKVEADIKRVDAKLNNPEFGAKAKLKGEVTCTTCHATDPREQ